MEQVDTAAKKAATEPPVTKDQPFPNKLEKANFVIVGDKWLTDPFRDPAAGELELVPPLFAICATDAQSGKLEDKDFDFMKKCLGWEYLAVVRARSVTMPRVNLASKTFTPGSFDGDLLLFELKSGIIRGRYRMSITNSDEVSWIEGRSEQEWLDATKRDLAENVTGVIEERLQLERESTGG